MYQFKCVLWWIIWGVKYQVIGYSNESPMMARRDANHRMCELLEEDRVPLNIDITRSGEEYYEWGNATCMSLWRNAQARSPWENAWI